MRFYAGDTPANRTETFFLFFIFKCHEVKTFFEKKVLPLKLPFPKNFKRGEKHSINNNQSDQRERILAGARQRGLGAAPRRPPPLR